MTDRSIAEHILTALGRPELLDTLADELSGSELSSVLMEVMARRATQRTASHLINQYRRDRFVAPSPLDLADIAAAELGVLESLPATFSQVMLSPLVPFGTHAALGGVSQNNVVTTARGSEVAADPTAGLALEAALRRMALLATEPRSPQPVHLATSQRITRAQTFHGPRSYAHFTLLGLVSAGRDAGNGSFEHASMGLHIRTLADACRAAHADEVAVAITDFSGRLAHLVDQLIDELTEDGIQAVPDPDRAHARGYYAGLCFKLDARIGGERHEYGDGGHVSWTQDLVGSRKERLMISGLSIDRLALDSEQ